MIKSLSKNKSNLNIDSKIELKSNNSIQIHKVLLEYQPSHLFLIYIQTPNPSLRLVSNLFTINQIEFSKPYVIMKI